MLSEKDFEFVLNVLHRTVNIAGFDEASHSRLISDQDKAYEIMSAYQKS